jgi:hypothetical protein
MGRVVGGKEVYEIGRAVADCLPRRPDFDSTEICVGRSVE